MAAAALSEATPKNSHATVSTRNRSYRNFRALFRRLGTIVRGRSARRVLTDAHAPSVATADSEGYPTSEMNSRLASLRSGATSEAEACF